MAAIGKASKKGILIKNGTVLEIFNKINAFLFDKTGTLTYGNPEVTFVKCFDKKMKKDEFINIVSNVEKQSEHVIGKAITEYSKKSSDEFKEVEDFKLLIGKGVTGTVDGKEVLAGNLRLIEENKIDISKEYIKEIEKYINKVATIIYVAIEKVFKGFIVLEDTIKETTKEAISQLNNRNVETVLLTGDHEKTAKNIAKLLNIKKVYSECSPENKLNIINDLEEENKKVCMIGDGINDAPSLKKADVGIAMGKLDHIWQ